jgi:predicted ATPase/DNA-binding winged helix-turn-helix (wHTH) protein
MFVFGNFTLLPAQQVLLHSQRAVPLGGRAFALLLALVERAGELVEKDLLIRLLWPDTIVEECNLRSQVSAVRRALGCGRRGERFIITVAGRGYRFVAPVSRTSHDLAEGGRMVDSLPARLTSVIAREEEIARVRSGLTVRRLVTITGAGGIGKTTVAVEAARGLVDAYPDGVRLIDFSPVADDALAPSHLAAALGLANVAENPTERLIGALHDRRMLLVFDGCEHVLGAVAKLVESILKGAPRIDLIATSREPLMADGESVLRLPSLDFPQSADDKDPNDLLNFTAVQLFVERSAESLVERSKQPLDLCIVAEICRKLDGNALAIEIAAGQLEAFGLRDLADLLDDHFVLLMRGRRTADRRQQTLRDTLDWSYGLLPAEERWLLRQLSVSAGEMSLKSCRAIAGPSPKHGISIADLVSRLVAKSLLSSSASPNGARFRLLDVTRAYALARLREDGEFSEAMGRLRAHLFDLLSQPDLKCLKIAENLRVVLDWAHSPAGDVRVAIDLTIAAIPYWFSVALIDECRMRVEQSLALTDAMTDVDREVMELNAGLVGVLVNTKGAGPHLVAAAERIMGLAVQLDDVEFQLRAYWALWVHHTNSGMHNNALEVARRFSETASSLGPSSYDFAAHRMLGISLHYTGDQALALQHLDQVLAAFNVPEISTRNIPFQFDQRVAALCYRARILHLLGSPNEALKVAAASVAEARALGHRPSLAYTLCEGALPIAISVGNVSAVATYVREALDSSRDPGFELWHKIAKSFEEWLHFRNGEVGDGISAMRAAIVAMRSVRYDPIYTLALGRFADALGRSGAHIEALGAIEQALLRAERGGELWCRAELLRIKAGLICAQLGTDWLPQATDLLRQARDEARSRGEICWQLRIAISLVKLGEPADELASLVSRSRDGFGSDDFVTALNLLNSRTQPTVATA